LSGARRKQASEGTVPQSASRDERLEIRRGPSNDLFAVAGGQLLDEIARFAR